MDGLMTELPIARNTSGTRINQYFLDENFIVAQELLEGKPHSGVKHVLLKGIEDFLRSRGIRADINNPSNLEHLIDTSSIDVVSVVGEAFHLVRKTVLTSYEFDETDPVQLTQNTFEALKPTDSLYAAQFIRQLCDLMSKDPNVQKNVVRVLETILPYISFTYTGKHARITSLNAFIDYTQKTLKEDGVMKRGEELVEDFERYLAQVNGQNKKSTRDDLKGYVAELLRKHGENYNTAITIFRQKAVLLGIHYDDRDQNRGRKIITLHRKHGGRNVLDYGTRGLDERTRDFFIALCNSLLLEENLPPEFRNMISRSRTRLEKYA